MEGCNRSGKEIVSKRIAASIQNYWYKEESLGMKCEAVQIQS